MRSAIQSVTVEKLQNTEYCQSVALILSVHLCLHQW